VINWTISAELMENITSWMGSKGQRQRT